MPDFGLLQMPNFAQAALGGYQAGQAIGRQRRTDAALQGLDFQRPETVLPLLAADPERGAAILGASLKLADARRQAEAGQAFGDAVAAIYGRPPRSAGGTGAVLGGAGQHQAALGGVSMTGSAPTVEAQPGAVNEPVGDEVVVTGRHQPPMQASVDPRQEAMIRLAYRDREGFNQLQEVVGKMDESQRRTFADSQDALATAAMIVRRLPYQDRRARIASMAPWLLQHHVSQDQIEGFDPTDEALDTLHDQAIGGKGMAEQAEKDRNFKLDQAKFGETVRSHRASEGVAAGNLKVRQGALKVAQARAGEGGDNSDLGYLMGGE